MDFSLSPSHLNSAFDYGLYGFGTWSSFFSVTLHTLVCSISDDPGALALAFQPQKLSVEVSQKIFSRSLKFEQITPFVLIEKNVCHLLKPQFSFSIYLNSGLENEIKICVFGIPPEFRSWKIQTLYSFLFHYIQHLFLLSPKRITLFLCMFCYATQSWRVQEGMAGLKFMVTPRSTIPVALAILPSPSQLQHAISEFLFLLLF